MPSLIKIFVKQRLWFKLLFFLFICISFFALFLTPFFQRNNLLNNNILQKKKILIRYKQLLDKKEEINQAYSQFFSSEPMQQGLDPLISALKELEGIAKKSGIKIIDIRQQATEAKGKYPQGLIEIMSEGRKEDYVKFIYELGDSCFLFGIKNFNLEAKENSPLLQGRFLISCIL